MKKSTLIITTLLLLSSISYSQDIFKSETYLGIKIGGNISGITSKPSIDKDIYPGYTAGLVLKHIPQKSMGIQVELNYKQAGWNEELDGTNIYTRRLNLIELPFMTHFNLGKEKTKIIINFGPYLSYLASEEETIILLNEVDKKSYYHQQTNNNTGYGLCFGLGISRNTSIGLLQLESRVTYTLTDNFAKTTDSYFSSSKNINAELTLCYMFDVKKL